MVEQSFPVLVSVSNPRTAPDGSTVVCTLQFANGTNSEVAIHAARIPILVNDLRTFGSLAEAIHLGLPSTLRGEELVAPYVVQTVAVAKASTGEVVLKIGTDQGIPVVLAFSTELATHTASRLVSEIERPWAPSPKN